MTTLADHLRRNVEYRNSDKWYYDKAETYYKQMTSKLEEMSLMGLTKYSYHLYGVHKNGVEGREIINHIVNLAEFDGLKVSTHNHTGDTVFIFSWREYEVAE